VLVNRDRGRFFWQLSRILHEPRFNPDSAVEREVMSDERSCRSEDDALLPLGRRQLYVHCVTT
jgi:hypothetical protein